MQISEIPIQQNAADIEPKDTEDGVGTTVRRWFAGWSPGDAPWNGEAFRGVFKPGTGAVQIVDDMGGEVVTLDSVDAYIETWTPFMARSNIGPSRRSARCAPMSPTISPSSRSPSRLTARMPRAARSCRSPVSMARWCCNIRRMVGVSSASI